MSALGQRSGKAKFVSVRVGDGEIALTPNGVAWCGIGLVSGSDDPRMHRVNVLDVEDRPPPPGPLPVVRLGGQIEIARTSTKAAESSIRSTVEEIEAKGGVEPYGASHVMGGESQRRDAFDHCFRWP